MPSMQKNPNPITALDTWQEHFQQQILIKISFNKKSFLHCK